MESHIPCASISHSGKCSMGELVSLNFAAEGSVPSLPRRRCPARVICVWGVLNFTNASNP
eukprot:865038-Pyramimonas_sp.AAC.1